MVSKAIFIFVICWIKVLLIDEDSGYENEWMYHQFFNLSLGISTLCIVKMIVGWL